MSSIDRAAPLSAAPTWRCPHCRTLQPESTRCRACSRAAVTCSTCYRYRRSIAADLGYCANDRTRAPLGGDEVRSCWEQGPGSSAVAGLFDEAELLLPARDEPPAIPATPRHSAAPGAEPSTSATEAFPSPGRLVDAPHVAPGRVLMSEIERRARGARG